MGKTYTTEELKMFSEIIDRARVIDYGLISAPGFSCDQLEKALKALRHLAARAWYQSTENAKK